MNYRNSLFTNVALALFLNFFAACSDDDNSAASSAKSEKNEKVIPTIILDTDIGSSTDDLFALQSLYRCHQAKTCNFIG